MTSGWRGALLAALVAALAVRLLALSAIDAAGLGDPNYYEDVGQALARGEGLTSRCVWNLLHLPAALPGPGCGYWGPGVPAVSGLAHALGGPSVRAPQVAILILSLGLSGLAVWLATWFLRDASALTFCGLLMAFHLQITFFAVTVDTPIPFAVAANLCLMPLALAHRGWTPGFFLALPGALAAQLTRADGLLLPVLVFAFAALAWRRNRVTARVLALMVVVYLGGYHVWLVHNLHAFGTPFPSSMAEGVLLADYSDLFRIHTRPSLARLIALGPARLVADKLGGLVESVSTLVFGENKLLLFCAALGFPALAAEPLAAPFLAYFVSLVLALSLLFTHQSRFGSLLHSLPALFPFLVVSALFGLERTRERAATWPPGRRRYLVRTLATLGPGLLLMFSALQVVPALVSPAGVRRPFRELGEVRATVASWWSQPGVGGPDVRLMSNDSLDLLGMVPAPIVQEPRDPGTAAVFELARRYRLRYFVVFRIPRYKTGEWNQPRYTDPGGELVHVADLPAKLGEIELDGIAIYEFRLAR